MAIIIPLLIPDGGGDLPDIPEWLKVLLLITFTIAVSVFITVFIINFIKFVIF